MKNYICIHILMQEVHDSFDVVADTTIRDDIVMQGEGEREREREVLVGKDKVW